MFFFFNDTATTEIYTLSLHDALPISPGATWRSARPTSRRSVGSIPGSERPATTSTCAGDCRIAAGRSARSEEHTSELQSRPHLVCRLLLEKKKKNNLNRRIYDDLICS